MSYNYSIMSVQLLHFWELLWGMTEKELRARYKHTVFGFLWLVANPVLQMLIIGFVFPLFIQKPVDHYFYYLFTGLLAWNFFAQSLSKTTPAIVNERSLIKKSAFPRAVIPVSIILSNLINYVAAFGIFLIPILFLGTLNAFSLLYFLGSLSILITFTIGLSLLTSALNVRYRDVNFLVQAILIVWFYATPVVYSLSQIPHKLIWVWQLNPLTSAIQLMQHALLGTTMPTPAALISNILIITAVTLIGVIVFYKESKTFDDWI